ncbi:MAG: Lrp/AsnC family transcriptional regulator [Rhizobiaceae bacterium]|nr:Lrp/AsnC family transcriptional regulator [Rhizobiaceae bacterium]
MELSQVDRQLLSVLKHDSRASVTTLASTLGVSRNTVQTRLERLVAGSIIRRFTIEVDSSVEENLVRAVMMVEIEGARARSVTAALKRIPEVASLHTTNGSWDLVAQIEAGSLADFDRILREVREIRGVLNSETSLLLNRAVA